MSNIHVVVSGITGFIGAQITTDLLNKGYTVHGTLRKNTPEKIAHLPTDAPGTLKVFEADLLTPNSFDEATKDCKYAIHVASPYVMNVKDPQRDLVDPALKGTLSFLESCKKNGIEKVIVTSSTAAVSDSGSLDKVFDESDWNTHSSLHFLPYCFSKAEAERAAWKFSEENDLKIVVINPPMVYGPSLIKSMNETATQLAGFLNGELPGIMDLLLPVVDVRDVSEAHIRAMESDTASGRYICCSTEPMIHHRELSRLLTQEGFSPTTHDFSGSFMTKLFRVLSPIIPGGAAGQFVQGHIGNPMTPTGAKIVKELNMQFIPAEQSVIDTIHSMEKWGHITKAKS